MDEALRELVHDWLWKAGSDLGSARKLAGGDDPYLDTAVYHCQQSAEKAIKAFLAFHDRTISRTHNLVALVREASELDPRFAELMDDAADLTPYGTQYRYPAEALVPTVADAEASMDAAGRVLGFVRELLPPETHPAS